MPFKFLFMKNHLVKTIAILSFTLLLLALIIFSCKRSTSPIIKPPDNPDEWETPRANREAEEAALWLSDSLIAPEYLYNKILYLLAAIREKYGEEIPQVQITFTPPWVTSQLLLVLTEEAIQQIRAGEYHNLDYLNSALRLTSMDTTLLRAGPIVLLIFEGRLHPKRLAELYEPVPSVIYAGPNQRGGDRSNVYPWIIGGGLSYLFREAWGDCPSGCIYSCYWYFEVTSSGIEYVGAWDPALEPEPDWWERAKRGMYHYRGYK